MKKLTLIMFLAISIASCKKTYKYTVTGIETSAISPTPKLVEQNSVDILADSDTAAYIDAYLKFCTAIKIDSLSNSKISYSFKPKSFKLVSKNGIDISSITFATKEQRQKDIQKVILGLDSVYSKIYSGSSSTVSNNTIDSAKIKELTPFFRIKKDEFSNNNEAWYEPKNAPKFANANGIYCYFKAQNNKPLPLRLRIQYHAEEWLFFKAVQFAIDGKAFEYIPDRTETDHGNGGKIWEWSDEMITDKDLITALSNAKSAKMKLIGRQYFDIKTITPNQINDIRRSVELYKAMGGQL